MCKFALSAKKLPVAEPIIKGISGLSHLQSIALLHPNGKDWFFENYINFCAIYFYSEGQIPKLETNFINYPQLTQFHLYEFQPQQVFCPLISTFDFDPLYIMKQTNIIDFIKYNIDLGKYLVLFLDRKYSLQKGEGNSRIHDAFIYGYDDEKQVVHIGEFANKFAFLELPYQLFNSAYRSACDMAITLERPDPRYDEVEFVEYNKITVLSLMPHKAYTFDLTKFKNRLSEYYRGVTPTVAGNSLYNEMFLKKWKVVSSEGWGIQSYLPVIQYLQSISPENAGNIDIKPFHLLYEHKVSLAEKITYILGLSASSHDVALLLNEAGRLKNVTLSARNLVLKYTMNNRHRDKERIINIYNDAYVMEKNLVFRILELLDKPVDFVNKA